MDKALESRATMEEVEPNEPEATEGWSFSNLCNTEFLKTVLTVRDMFCPVSLRKVLWFTSLAIVLGGVIAVEVTTGAFTTAATYDNYAIMALLYAVDPVMQLAYITTAKYPPALLPPAPHEIDQEVPPSRNSNSRVAIIIPTHYAAGIIEDTVRSCLAHVHARQIFILDNGNSDVPLDNTREVVRNIDRAINYCWGHIGNKTFAQYVGTLLAKEFDVIFTIDHDMRLPTLFSFETHLLNETVKALCFPIRAVHPIKGESNILVRWQDIEYLLAGCAKQSQSRLGGALFPHGAVSLWDRNVFLEVLEKHDAVFYAEDVKLGMILKELGYRMDIAGSAYLDTIAPETLFGNKPNFYEQRVRSWEMGRQRYSLKFMKQLFTVLPPSRNPVDFSFYKLNEFYAVYTNIVDWWRLPMFILLVRYPSYWMRMAIIIAAGNIPVLLWNYVKLPLAGRQDLQCSLLDILSYPLFKLLESGMSIGGLARLMGVVIPNYTPKPDMQELISSFQTNREALMNEVMQNDRSLGAPLTYKRVMVDRFFKPAVSVDEIFEQFDASSFFVP